MLFVSTRLFTCTHFEVRDVSRNNDQAHARLLSDSGSHSSANTISWLESRTIERGTEEPLGAFSAPTSFRNPLFSVVLESEYEDDTETVGLLQ